MTLALAGLSLDGPFYYFSDLEDECGVFVVARCRIISPGMPGGR